MKKLLLAVSASAIVLLAGCGGSGGSVSGGSSNPALNICQSCSTNNQCASGRCVRFTSGIWRCVPQDARPGYRCPGGMYSLQGEVCE